MEEGFFYPSVQNRQLAHLAKNVVFIARENLWYRNQYTQLIFAQWFINQSHNIYLRKTCFHNEFCLMTLKVCRLDICNSNSSRSKIWMVCFMCVAYWFEWVNMLKLNTLFFSCTLKSVYEFTCHWFCDNLFFEFLF